ncbi:MAG: hypothetical protein IJL05_03445 [Alphaproteobacteria bacterium]|nr:hypothetical protein [Alphaproteobacteria bacterium]
MTEKMFSKSWFEQLDSKIRAMGLDSDLYSFDETLKHIKSKTYRVSPDEFVSCAAYSILASGFKQTTAKTYHEQVMKKLPENPHLEDLLDIFENANKMYAIWKIWNNRNEYCADYYECKTLEDKLNFLETLPYIGKITNRHLARNLGEDTPKYDIWVQRLGIIYSGNNKLEENNAKLTPEIQRVCDDMFNHLIKETGFPRGYIDAVLFKAASNGLIEVVAEKKKGKKSK